MIIMIKRALANSVRSESIKISSITQTTSQKTTSKALDTLDYGKEFKHRQPGVHNQNFKEVVSATPLFLFTSGNVMN